MSGGALKIEGDAARLGGRLTFSTVKPLYEAVVAAARDGKLPRTLDLAEVSQIDSAGLALLLEWQSVFRRETGSDKLMDIHHPPEALLKIARLCDAENYLGSGSSTEQDPQS